MKGINNKMIQSVVRGLRTFTLVGILSLSLVGVFSTNADAAPKDEVCKGVVLTGGTCNAGEGEAGIGRIVQAVINILSVIVGAISVIMIIIGGLRYVISNGDPGATTSARQTIIYALVGLAVVIMAQAIVGFVIGRIDGQTTTTYVESVNGVS